MLHLLGPLAVTSGPVTRSPSSARGRSTIAALALRAGEHVSTTDLAMWIWGEDDAMADHPVAAIHTCMCRLRRFLCPDAAGRAPVSLDTVPGGYVLTADPSCVDAIRFERALAAARALIARGELDQAAQELTGALALWSGQPLADVAPTPPAVAAASKLNELRLVGMEMLCDTQIRRGLPEAVVGELAALTAEHPLRESLAGRYMLALSRCGDRHGAMNVYTSMYRRLDEELGVRPCQAMSDLYTEVLKDTGAVTGPAPRAPDPAVAAGETPVRPAIRLSRCILPPVPRTMLPRQGEIDRLDKAIETSMGGTPRIAVVTGPPGVGKTTLAIQYAMQRRANFPGGAYFLSLSDCGADEDEVGEALGALLAELGAGPIPDGTAMRLARYHEVLAERRAMVILDGAVSTDHVRPFIAGDQTCFLVTSVRQLHDLADTGTVIPVRRLPDERALWLLGELAAEAHRASTAEVATLVTFCEGLPLTIRIVAAHLATGYYPDVRAAVAALRDPRDRLAELEYGKLSVHGSYMRATAVCGAAEMLALGQLARHAPVAASVAELEKSVGPALDGQPARPAQAIRGLVQANLLEVQDRAPGGRAALTMLALCRAFAAEAAPVAAEGRPSRRRRLRDMKVVPSADLGAVWSSPPAAAL